MMIPTEPIGSIPRPPELIAAVEDGSTLEAIPEAVPEAVPEAALARYKAAARTTILRLAASGSPVPAYCVHGAPDMSPDRFPIPLAAGYTGRSPRLTRAPFRYQCDTGTVLTASARGGRP